MTSLTHPAHHRNQTTHSHGSTPFSAIRFHALELANSSSQSTTLAPSSCHSLIYNNSLLPSFPCHPSSVLVHATNQNAHQNHPFGPFAAAFAGTLLGPSLIGANSALGILPVENGQSEINSISSGSLLEFGQSKDSILAENSPPQLSITSLSSASFGADSDGLSCSPSSEPNSTQANAAQNQEGQPMDRIENDQQHQREGAKEANEQQQQKSGTKKQLIRDETYWERRRKNNDAAKRSRDSRRKKEDEVAVRAVILEQENLRLRFELERLRTEIERHRLVAFNQGMVQHHQQQQQNCSKFGEHIVRNASSLFASTAHHPMALAAAAAAAAAAAMVNERNGNGQQQNLALFPPDTVKIGQANDREMAEIVSSSTSI